MNKFLLLLVATLFCVVTIAEGLRDPTLPVGQTEIVISEDEYNLQYIINRNGDYIAAINGQILKVSDNFRDMRVTKIDNSSIELITRNDKKIILQLIENVNKNYEQK